MRVDTHLVQEQKTENRILLIKFKSKSTRLNKIMLKLVYLYFSSKLLLQSAKISLKNMINILRFNLLRFK